MNETLRTIHSLHTTHGNFRKDREVSQEDLQTILEASVRAASASGMQTYSIIAIEDKQVMQEICGYTASRLLVFCVDYNRLVACARRLGHACDPDGVLSFITGSTNTMLAAQTAVLAATALGINNLLTNGIHRVVIEKLYARLNLPERHCFPLIALALGYADTPDHVAKRRLCGPGVIHFGRYQPLTDAATDQVIADCDDRFGMTDDWRKDGLAHYLDWFFTRWMGKPSPEKQQEFLRVLQRAGFFPSAA